MVHQFVSLRDLLSRGRTAGNAVWARAQITEVALSTGPELVRVEDCKLVLERGTGLKAESFSISIFRHCARSCGRKHNRRGELRSLAFIPCKPVWRANAAAPTQ